MAKYPELQQESLRRYREKIEWAKTQPPDERPNELRMIEVMNLGWGAVNCPYCLKFNYHKNIIRCQDLNDNNCPLDGGTCGCCNGLWENIVYSETWAEWIINAEAVYKFIEENG